MSVAQDLGAVLDFAEQPLSRLDVFTDHIPQEWISTAATLAEKATVRRRRLPSDMVHRRVSAWAISLCLGYFDSAPVPGDTSATRRMTGTDFRFLPSMVRCFEPRKHLSYVRTLAQATPPPIGRRPTRCCVLSR
ncbi:transposase-like protein [Pseudomonas syringae pv. actinidiae ICMP 19097]|nr:transposase-like protein [Pseudomonas syringae pv. actinidiae ICMP 19097]